MNTYGNVWVSCVSIYFSFRFLVLFQFLRLFKGVLRNNDYFGSLVRSVLTHKIFLLYSLFLNFEKKFEYVDFGITSFIATQVGYVWTSIHNTKKQITVFEYSITEYKDFLDVNFFFFCWIGQWPMTQNVEWVNFGFLLPTTN